MTAAGSDTLLAEVERLLENAVAVKSRYLRLADRAARLARHGLNVDLRRINAGDVDVANVILSDAADRDTDFIVMGGYGHSRLREFVFGGATRGILDSMTVPTLMSH